MTPQGAPVPRTAGRVILLDARDRALFLAGPAHTNVSETRVAWFLPGGGMGPGEDVATTAARERFAETGLRVRPGALRGPVAVTGGVWGDGATTYREESVFDLLRVPRWAVVTAGFTALEREVIVGPRWWSLDERQRTAALVFPRAFAPLLARLLATGVPETPVALPW
jgi:8-oxo-dGTP pyrophosphatase MutT (NUDIX family)